MAGFIFFFLLILLFLSSESYCFFNFIEHCSTAWDDVMTDLSCFILSVPVCD